MVSNLGLVNATRFIMQSETGQGDYTAIRKSVFKGKRVADLYRDINESLFKYPFDAELKLIGKDFTQLLVPMVETIDKYG